MSTASKSFAARFKSALGLILKGTPFPFNRVGLDTGAGEGEKLTRPYAKSVWVQRAIKHIAGPIASIDIDFSTDARRGKAPYKDARLKQWWERPAVGMSRSQFIKATVTWRKLAGESFWILGDDFLAPFPEVKDPTKFGKIILARPDRMRHVVQNGVLEGWEYRDGAGVCHSLIPEQVVQLKQFNPYEEWRGLGELEAAQISAETDFLSGLFARNLMRNNGDRGPYIIAKNGVVGEPQREQIIADLRAKRFAAGRGEFRPVFLTGDITVEDPSIQGLDANVLAQRVRDAEEVFVAFGVPPSMSKSTASYSVGSASDRFRLIEETCIPESAEIADGIEVVVLRQTGKVLFASFDWDEHSVMQQVRAERIDTAMKLWGTGYPMDTVSDYLGLDLPRVPASKQGYLPFSVAPVGGLTPDDDPSLGEPADDPKDPGQADEKISEMMRAIQSRKCTKKVPACECGFSTSIADTEFQKTRDPRETAMWRELMGKRRKSVKAYESRFNRELMIARSQTLSRIQKYRMIRALVQKEGAAIDLVFDNDTWKNGLLEGLGKVAKASLQTAGEQLFEEVKRDDPFTMAPEKALMFIRQRNKFLSGVSDEVWERVKLAIEQGLKDGISTDQLMQNVRAEFNDISEARALTIAQTETGAAYGYARAEAMKQAKIKYKQWLTSGNANVRPAHMEANGQTVEVDETFYVDDEEIMYPGDSSGSPENIINCHCIAISVEAPKENE